MSTNDFSPESDDAKASAMTLHPIGYVKSPFHEKFGIPRQANLLAVPGKLIISPPYNQRAAFEGIESVSHIWLHFLFDQHGQVKKSSQLRVRPPRLGGNQKLGVFATRSSFRPNGLGLSLLKLVSVNYNDEVIESIDVEGLDVVDGSPIIDIKPYLPYADVAADAINVIATEAPNESLRVIWPNSVDLPEHLNLSEDESRLSISQLKTMITSLIALDPRPAYHKGVAEREYGLRFAGLNTRFTVSDQQATILSCLADH